VDKKEIMWENDSYEKISSQLTLNSKFIRIGIPLFLISVALLFIGIGMLDMKIIIFDLFFILLLAIIGFHTEGIAINNKRDNILKYTNHLFRTKGTVYPIKNYQAIGLKLEVSNTTPGTFRMLGGHGSIHGASASWYKTSYRGYVIFLKGTGKNDVVLKEFNKPKLAFDFQKQMSNLTSLQTDDSWINKMKDRKQKRNK